VQKKSYSRVAHTSDLMPWDNPYDFWIYSYNASVVVGYSVFQIRIKYFCFQNTLGYPWRCKNLQRWRCDHDRMIGSRKGVFSWEMAPVALTPPSWRKNENLWQDLPGREAVNCIQSPWMPLFEKDQTIPDNEDDIGIIWKKCWGRFLKKSLFRKLPSPT
jgi:hypothetical protein